MLSGLPCSLSLSFSQTQAQTYPPFFLNTCILKPVPPLTTSPLMGVLRSRRRTCVDDLGELAHSDLWPKTREKKKHAFRNGIENLPHGNLRAKQMAKGWGAEKMMCLIKENTEIKLWYLNPLWSLKLVNKWCTQEDSRNGLHLLHLRLNA